MKAKAGHFGDIETFRGSASRRVILASQNYRLIPLDLFYHV